MPVNTKGKRLSRIPAVIVVAFIAGIMNSHAWAGKYEPEQPINFSHNKHWQYLGQGVHKKINLKLHEEFLGEIPEELRNGECTLCHGDFEEAVIDFPNMKLCAGCHRLFDEKVLMEEPTIKPCVGCHRKVMGHYAATIPNVNVCVSCHGQQVTNDSEETKLRNYLNQKEDIPWNRVYDYLPGDIVFSHKSHVKWGKIDCKECHGNVQAAIMPLKLEVKLSMDDCVDCHEKRNANIDCLTCHK